MASLNDLTKVEVLVLAELCPGFTNAIKVKSKAIIIEFVQQNHPDVDRLTHLKQKDLAIVAKRCPGYNDQKPTRKTDLIEFIKAHLPPFWPQARKGQRKRVFDIDESGELARAIQEYGEDAEKWPKSIRLTMTL